MSTAPGQLPADTPSSDAALYRRAEASLPGAGLGGYSLPEDVRFVIREGRGGRVISTAGREYVDYVCGAGATIIGHDHPAVVEAVRERVGRGMHFFGTLNDAAIELAARLVEYIPCADKVVLTSTGSEATAYAMRIARAFTGRERVLKFEGAYHCNHDYAAISQFPTRAANYPHAGADSGGVPAAIGEAMLVAPYNDLASVESILAEHARELAAVIVEPVQRIVFPQPGFLEGLRALCDRHGVLLVFDEVVTGFRLAPGGAQAYFGVTPDLAAYGKIVGGGGPLGCVAGRADIIECCNPAKRGHADYAYVNGTLHGNPIAAVAGLATLEVIVQPGFHATLNNRADRFRAAMQAVLDEYQLPARIAGRASFWQPLFIDHEPRDAMDLLVSDMPRARRLDHLWLKHGVFVLPGVRRFFSAAHDEADLARTLEALHAACAGVA